MTYDPTKRKPTDLKEIKETGLQLAKAKHLAKRMEEKLEVHNQLIKTMEDEVLPDMMREIGITSLELEDGTKIVMKDLVFAKIKDQEEAFNWLKENDSDGIIKYGVAAQLERGDKETANKVVESGIAVCCYTLFGQLNSHVGIVLQVWLDGFVEWTVLLSEFWLDCGVDTEATVEALLEFWAARIGVDQVKGGRCEHVACD